MKILKITLIVLASLLVLFFVGKWYLFSVYLGFDIEKKDKLFHSTEIVEYYQNTLDINNIYVINQDKHHVFSKGAFPKIRLFDKNRHELNVKGCFESFPNVFESFISHLEPLNPDKKHLSTDNQEFIAALSEVNPLNNSSLHKSDKDYIMVYYFPIFMRKFNEEKLKPMLDLYKDDKRLDILVVNVDSVRY